MTAARAAARAEAAAFPPASRHRVNESCCWPERVGLIATVIGDPGGRKSPGSPWLNLPADRVVVLIADDPLQTEWALWAGWSCVMPKSMLDRIGRVS